MAKSKRKKTDEPFINKHTSSLMLWTKSGIALHAKMLNTPQAWEFISQLAEAVPDDKFFEILENLNVEPETNTKKVYVFDFGDRIKIGVSADVPKRKSSLETGGDREVRQEWTSAAMPSEKAFAIEKRAHEHFAEYRLKGEYFSVPFEEARRVLQELSSNV